jgi:putative DNA primase/helicase
MTQQTVLLESPQVSTSVPCTGWPHELVCRPQWVAWRSIPRAGKLTKVPYSPLTGERASPTAPTTWGTYKQAIRLCEQMGMDGVGYVFSAEDPYTGIDLDKCRDPTTGAIEA